MTEFLQALFGFPVAIYTGLLGIAVLYWLMVIVGAADIDLFGGGAEGALEGATEGALEGAAEGALEGAAEGALEGAAEGALEGATEGAMEGAAEGALEGAAEGAAEAAGEGSAEGAAEAADALELSHATPLMDAMAALHLRRAPVTVVYSLFSLTGWVITMTAALTLEPILGGLVPSWLYAPAMFALSVPLALVLTSFGVKPLAPLFAHETVHGQHALVGRSCLINTGSANNHFGQGRVEKGGDVLLLNVRTSGTVIMRKNEEALITDYDPEKDVYTIEPLQALLKEVAG